MYMSMHVLADGSPCLTGIQRIALVSADANLFMSSDGSLESTRKYLDL